MLDEQNEVSSLDRFTLDEYSLNAKDSEHWEGRAIDIYKILFYKMFYIYQ